MRSRSARYPSVDAGARDPAGRAGGRRPCRALLRALAAGRRRPTVFAGHMLNSSGAPGAICRFLEDVARDGRTCSPRSAGDRPPACRTCRACGRLADPRAGALADRRRGARPRAARATRRMRSRRRWPGWRDGRGRSRAASTWRGRQPPADRPRRAEPGGAAPRRSCGGWRTAGAVVLQEPLPDPASSWLPGPVGRHVSELVVPLVLREPGPEDGAVRAPGRRRCRAADRDARLRPPGSDWLYLKLYGPGGVEEDVIAGPVRWLGEFAVGGGLAAGGSSCATPIPIRICGCGSRGDRAARGGAAGRRCALAAELVADGTCERVALDTYEREVERYGGQAATEVAEALFAADSARRHRPARADRAAPLVASTGPPSRSSASTSCSPGSGWRGPARLARVPRRRRGKEGSGDADRNVVMTCAGCSVTRVASRRTRPGPRCSGYSPCGAAVARPARGPPSMRSRPADRLERTCTSCAAATSIPALQPPARTGLLFVARLLGLLLRTREGLDALP